MRGAAFLLLAAVAAGAAPEQPEASRRMAARLAEIARQVGPDYRFASDQRAARLRLRLAAAAGHERLLLTGQLVEELLNAGQPEEALALLEQLEALPAELRARLPGFDALIGEYRGLAWLRVGERGNCVARHNADSCLVPIEGGGVHRDPTGSRNAIAAYERLLARNPDELSWKWLLNIAYQTLGEYPAKVPERHLIPPRVFDSERDFPRFTNIAAERGVDRSGHAGGCVAEDLDGDGDLDLVASSWGLDDPLKLFRNEGRRFSDRSAEAAFEGLTGGLHVVQTDYDNDGRADLLVLRGAWAEAEGRFPNSLLRNLGGGRFADVTEEAGLLTFQPTQVGVWADYDNDGWLDLFIGNESTEANPAPSELWHNERDGRFTNRIADLGRRDLGWVKGAAWIDIDNDGRQDLFVSVNRGDNLLFHNQGPDGRGWSFRERGREAGVLEPRDSFAAWSWDHDNDGWLDLFVAGYRQAPAGSIAALYLGLPGPAEVPRLYRNRRDGSFEDLTRAARLDRVAMVMGSNHGDIDNDGWPDAYLGTGTPDLRALLPNRMFRNAGGARFEDVTTAGGFGHLQKGHGVCFADLDDDGDVDVYAVIGGAFTDDTGYNVLFDNPGTDGRWIKLRLRGVRSDRPGIGARLRLRVATPGGPRDVHALVSTGGSFGANPFEQHIGLGDATAIEEIEVRWPGGGTQRLAGPALDGAYELTEGSSKLRRRRSRAAGRR